MITGNLDSLYTVRPPVVRTSDTICTSSCSVLCTQLLIRGPPKLTSHQPYRSFDCFNLNTNFFQEADPLILFYLVFIGSSILPDPPLHEKKELEVVVSGDSVSVFECYPVANRYLRYEQFRHQLRSDGKVIVKQH